MLALITVILGVIPSMLAKHFRVSVMVSIIGLPITWSVYYFATPALVNPLWGAISVMIILFWVVLIIVQYILADNGSEDEPNGAFIAVVGFCIVIMLMIAISGWAMFRSTSYAKLLGNVEKREWTADIQPKDPKHVRLVPLELAYYLATKQLGEAPGAIGSQFQIEKESLTLQLIKGELWYVAPLDYRGFSVWTKADSAPGYVMVNGEDPKMQAIVKTDCKFRYMPGAYFGDNLQRHIWHDSVGKYALTDYSFEIDDDGNPWWVVTAYKPTIAWWGEKVAGVYISNPTSGDTTFYPVGEVPSWVDRVVPSEFVQKYVAYRGKYSEGWCNSWWGKDNISEPEDTSLVYGSDNQPYWVTSITSKNDKDTSLIGLVYTETRTGKSVEYHAIGGTEKSIIDLVNNKVSYKKLHGSSPVLYNIYGVMTSIVPLLGESHSYQGVAMVDVANMQLAVGDDLESTLRQYQKIVTAGTLQNMAPDKAHELQSITGVVDRVMSEISGNETVYYLHLAEQSHLFSGVSDLSPKLRMAQKGDEVVIGFIASDEDVVPILKFDLPKLILTKSKNQEELNNKVKERLDGAKERENARDARGQIKNMTDEQLQELLIKAEKSGK